MKKYKIKDKVDVRVYNFTDTECVYINGIIESIEETTESGETLYSVYIPATKDILYIWDKDIIPEKIEKNNKRSNQLLSNPKQLEGENEMV